MDPHRRKTKEEIEEEIWQLRRSLLNAAVDARHIAENPEILDGFDPIQLAWMAEQYELLNELLKQLKEKIERIRDDAEKEK